MANILKVEDWEVKIDYPERFSKQEKEKGCSREMCQSYFTTRLNPSYFTSPRESFCCCTLNSNIKATLLFAPFL